MSTLAYAALTSQRQIASGKSAAKTSTSSSTSVASYVDALAALVPAEVLALHAALLTFTTAKNESGVTVITELPTLFYSFFGCILVTMIVYVLGLSTKWDPKTDIPRMIIPALAFVGWTMIQRTTAFDAVWPSLNLSVRTAVGIFGGAILGAIAAKLAKT